jgi:hypothetical protein
MTTTDEDARAWPHIVIAFRSVGWCARGAPATRATQQMSIYTPTSGHAEQTVDEEKPGAPMGLPFSDDELAEIRMELLKRRACVAVLFVVVICLWCPWCSESNEPGIPPCKHGMCETDMSNNESASVWLGNGCCKSVAVWLVGR